MAKYYISDYHIGHEKILTYDERPFKSLDEMHECIIRRWNSVVNSGDCVYILGDFAWHNETGIEVIRQLKGNKILVKGNHDRLTAPLEKEFVRIEDYLETADEGRKLVLCHYPIAHWRNADNGTVHLYGHIHTGRDSRPFEKYKMIMKVQGSPYECYNVGCMLSYMNYTPRRLDEITEGAKDE